MRELAERENYDLAASYAYSDSATDIPMLEAVGHPFAVNPDKQLRAKAEELGWPILEFKRPVSLKEGDQIQTHLEPGCGRWRHSGSGDD